MKNNEEITSKKCNTTKSFVNLLSFLVVILITACGNSSSKPRLTLIDNLVIKTAGTITQSVKLTSAEIATLLTGNTAIGKWQGANYRQYFDANGTTIDSDQEDEQEDWYNCRTREVWTAEKQEWCDDFMDKEGWHKLRTEVNAGDKLLIKVGHKGG